MPSLQVVRSALSDLTNGPPLVAAFVGGTSGIGSYTAIALAHAYAKHGSKLRVYIVGRNAASAEKIIAECKGVCPESQWRFVAAHDLGEMKDVDRVSAELIQLEREDPFHGKPRLDLLYMSHAFPVLEKPRTTKEGLDLLMSLVYYSRMRFILQLMPLLEASALPAAHVVSVYAGGGEGGLSAGQSPIGTPPEATYGMNSVRKHSTYMKTFFFEQLAEKHPRLSLSHIFPGLVFTPAFLSEGMPTWFKIIWRILTPLLRLAVAVPEAECGQRMLYVATPRYPAKGEKKEVKSTEIATSTDGVVGGGAYSLNWNGETSPIEQKYAKIRKDGMSAEVWTHTMDTFARIEKDNAAAS